MHVADREWDVLVVLDACRFGTFKYAMKNLRWKGTLEKMRTKASTTTEFRDSWPEKPFQERFFYVSGNPYINSMNSSKKFKVIDASLWGWNTFHGVTPPEPVTDAALTLAAFGERMVVHYMQPHTPFLGESMRLNEWSKYRKPVKCGEKRVAEWIDAVPFPPDLMNAKAMLHFFPHTSLEPAMPGERLKPLKFEKREAAHLIALIKRAYLSNLYLVLRDVNRLRRYLKKAKIVVTADHGTLLGEPYKPGYDPNRLAFKATIEDVKRYGMWWHLEVFRHSALNVIPWFEPEKL